MVYRAMAMEGDVIKKNRKLHDVVEAGFLVGAMMKDENVREMKERKKVKKEEKRAENMTNIGALQFVM
jgi:hypothetical protein